MMYEWFFTGQDKKEKKAARDTDAAGKKTEEGHGRFICKKGTGCF